MTNIPIMGLIGHNSKETNLIVRDHPKSSLAESFRSLRANLKFLGKGETDPQVFLVTSSIGGEGKTFCSINLATVMALSKKKTILIGVDLRKPKIYNDFDLSNERGLSSYLIGQDSLEDVLQKTSIENLSLISAGPIPPNPSELIMSSGFKNLIDTLKKDFEYIVLDTPPIGLVADSFEIMKHVDFSFYVVRQNYTDKMLLNFINERFEQDLVSDIAIIVTTLR